MIDSGATGLFIDYEFARNNGFKAQLRAQKVRLRLFNGQSAGLITKQVKARFTFGENEQELTFEVTKLAKYPIVLGLPWLHTYNPNINWKTFSLAINAVETEPMEDEKEKLKKTIPEELHEYLEVFSKTEAMAMPPHRPWDIDIIINDNDIGKIGHGRVYPLSKEENNLQKEWVNEHLEKGFIVPSKSEISASTFFVKKKDNSGRPTGKRIVVDYRRLNQYTKKDRYPIPNIGNLTDQVQGAKIFTKMDLRYGYHLVRIKKGDEWKTAFVAGKELYEYKVMPLGLCNAPAVFQRMMNTIFRDMIDDRTVIYLDDILIYAKNEEELTQTTLEVLRRLKENKLYVKPEKCLFKVKEVEFLGAFINEKGVIMDVNKTKAIEDWPIPKTVRQLQAFLGLCNFYRRFIKNYSKIAKPLTRLTGNVKWEWKDEQQLAFDKLKQQFKHGSILIHPDPEKPFFVETDASDYAMGGELSQIGEDGKRHPVAFYSASLADAERNYDIHDKELLAVIKSLRNWRHYLQGAKHQVTIMTDHRNLEVFRTTKKLTPRQMRWSEELANYDIIIKYQPGAQSGRTDALSRRADHKPDDRPELIGRIFTDEQFAFATAFVPIMDENGILSEIHKRIGADEKAQTFIKVIKETKKPYEDWTWDDEFLRYKNRIYVPNHKDLRTAVLHLFHDTKLGGHRGPKATQELIYRTYYWPRMGATIEDYVTGCDLCQRNNPNRHAKYGLLQPLEVPDRKWTHISYDFITGLPTCEEKDAILVVVDRFSKGAHFIPCKTNETAESTAKLFLHNVWKLHGTPESTISDRGTQFNNAFTKRLYELLDIKPSFSTAYHPETDGQTERTNQTLENYLRHFVNNAQNDWVDLLPTAEWSYNNHVSESTGQSPFYIWYGEHPKFHPQGAREEKIPAAEELAKRIKESTEEAKAAIKMAQQRYKEQADKNRIEEPTFNIGDQVWLNRKYLTTNRPAEKMDYRKLGPFEIIEKIGKRAYKLKLPHTFRIHNVFHVSLLEKFTGDNFGRTPIPLPPVIVEGQEEYEVEKIVNSRWTRNRLEYYVQWKGYGREHDQWEPAKNVENAKDEIDKFHKANPNAASKARATITTRSGRKSTRR